MAKDFKVGLMVGMVALLVAVAWLSTRPGIGTQARLEKNHAQLIAQREPNRSISSNFAPPEPNHGPRPLPRLGNHAESPNRSLPPLSQELSPLRNASVETRQKIKTNLLHIVRPGETLSEIAHEYLGSSRHFSKLLEANQGVLTDPNKIRPGMKIVIPRE